MASMLFVLFLFWLHDFFKPFFTQLRISRHFQMGHTGRRCEKCIPHGLRCFGLAFGLDGGDASAGCRRSGGSPTRLACSESLATGLGLTSCKKRRFWRWNSVKPMRKINLSEAMHVACPFLAFSSNLHQLKGLLGFLQSSHGIADVVVHAMACDAAGRLKVCWDVSWCLNSNAGKGIFQIIGKGNDGNNAMNAYECNIFTIGGMRWHINTTPFCRHSPSLAAALLGQADLIAIPAIRMHNKKSGSGGIAVAGCFCTCCCKRIDGFPLTTLLAKTGCSIRFF